MTYKLKVKDYKVLRIFECESCLHLNLFNVIYRDISLDQDIQYVTECIYMKHVKHIKCFKQNKRYRTLLCNYFLGKDILLNPEKRSNKF